MVRNGLLLVKKMIDDRKMLFFEFCGEYVKNILECLFVFGKKLLLLIYFSINN